MLVLSAAATGGGATTIWDAAQKSTLITLSGANLVATRTAGNNGNYSSVFSTTSYTTGKWYFEATITHDSDANTGWAIGISKAGTGLDGAGGEYVGHAPGSAGGLSSNSGTSLFEVNFGGLTTNPGWSQVNNPATGDVLGVAVDLTAGLMWLQDWTKANGWNVGTTGTQNPGTGVGGLNISSITGQAQFIKWSCFTSGSPVGVCTLNPGLAFFGTLPSGFAAWG
jgi:hypothetical protein